MQQPGHGGDRRRKGQSRGDNGVPLQSFDLSRACTDILDTRTEHDDFTNHERVLRACESSWSGSPLTGTTSPAVHTLFTDIRHFFPIAAQLRVYRVCDRYMSLAREYLDSHSTGVTFEAALVLPRDDPPRNPVPAHAAAGQRVLPVAQAPRRDRGRTLALAA